MNTLLETYDLEIVQPLYNPDENWVAKYCAHFSELQLLFPNVKLRIILVNDGSDKNFIDDFTKQLHEKITHLKIVSYTENKGKGFALRAGMKETTAPYILYTDYDFPYQLISLKNAYQKLVEGNDVVIGIRNESYYKQLSFIRIIISKLFNMFNKVILKIPYSDTQSGMKAFSTKGKELLLQTKINRFLFDTEFICKAYKDKTIKIVTINIELNNDVKFTKINALIILQEIKNMLSISWRLLRNKL
ncbi:MAG: glycosyltransferase family 2 protein [Bacteroidia bacterium]